MFLEKKNILDQYFINEPSNQNIVDIFKDEWASKLPDELDLVVKPGNSNLFDDDRIKWAEQVLGKFSGYKILELGPLEGGHSYMLQKKTS